MKQVKIIAAMLLLSFGTFAQTVTPNPGPYTPMAQKYQYPWIKTTGGVWNTGKFVQIDSAQFSGITYVPDAPVDDSSTQAANTRWIRQNISPGTPGTPTSVWQFLGNYSPTDPTLGRIGFIDSFPLSIITDNEIRMVIPDDGIKRSAGLANKVLMIDTITKNVYYADAGGGSGSYVPYTGASGNVDLGEYGVSGGYYKFDTSPTTYTPSVGNLAWNDTDGTLEFNLKGNNVTLQVGQEQVLKVVNKTVPLINLLESNYQACIVSGASGQRVSIKLAQADSELTSVGTIGIVTENINSNQEGFITTSGQVREINTTGSLQSETWNDGDVLYLSPTVLGGVTNVKPTAPNHTVTIGYVEYSHAVHGKIFVKIDNGYELGELHNVYAPTPANKDIVYWDSVNLRYQNNSINSILGYTPIDSTTLSDSLAYYLPKSDTAAMLAPYALETSISNLNLATNYIKALNDSTIYFDSTLVGTSLSKVGDSVRLLNGSGARIAAVFVGSTGTTVTSYGKNAGRDSTILVLSDATRYAAKDSIGGGGGGGGVTSGTYAAMIASAKTDGAQYSISDYIPGPYQYSTWDSSWRYMTAPDFTVNVNNIPQFLTVTEAGAGADGTNSHGYGRDSRLGIYRFMYTGSTATGSVRYYFSRPLYNTDTASFRAAISIKAMVSALSTPTQRFVALFGRALTSTASASGLFFRYCDSLNSGNIQAVSTITGTETVTNTSVAPDINRMQEFVITISSSGPLVGGTMRTNIAKYYINKVLVATHTTSIPDYIAGNLQIFDGLSIFKTVGTAGASLYFSSLKFWIYKKD
jgi:hypothetical protein